MIIKMIFIAIYLKSIFPPYVSNIKFYNLSPYKGIFFFKYRLVIFQIRKENSDFLKKFWIFFKTAELGPKMC